MEIRVLFEEVNNDIDLELSQEDSTTNIVVDFTTMAMDILFEETNAAIDLNLSQDNSDVDVNFGETIYIPVRESGNVTTLGPTQPNLPIAGDIWYDTN